MDNNCLITYYNKLREKYTLSQILTIPMHKNTNPEEYAEFKAYREKCLAEAKSDVNLK